MRNNVHDTVIRVHSMSRRAGANLNGPWPFVYQIRCKGEPYGWRSQVYGEKTYGIGMIDARELSVNNLIKLWFINGYNEQASRVATFSFSILSS